MIKAIIFDLDGTLLDTLEDLGNACNHALKACGFEEHPIKDYVRFVGSGRYVLIKRIVPDEYKENELVINKVLKLFDEYYGKHMVDMTKPYEGINDMLQKLKEKDFKLAVVSNKPHEFTTEVVDKYFHGVFDIVFGQRPYHKVKPDPAVVNEVMDTFILEKEQCIYVGDSDVDMQTAKNAGVKSIGVSWGFRGVKELMDAGANYIVNTAEEIIQLAREK